MRELHPLPPLHGPYLAVGGHWHNALVTVHPSALAGVVRLQDGDLLQDYSPLQVKTIFGSFVIVLFMLGLTSHALRDHIPAHLARTSYAVAFGQEPAEIV